MPEDTSVALSLPLRYLSWKVPVPVPVPLIAPAPVPVPGVVEERGSVVAAVFSLDMGASGCSKQVGSASRSASMEQVMLTVSVARIVWVVYGSFALDASNGLLFIRLRNALFGSLSCLLLASERINLAPEGPRCIVNSLSSHSRIEAMPSERCGEW